MSAIDALAIGQGDTVLTRSNPIAVDVPAAPDADPLFESDEMQRLYIDHVVDIGSAATDP